MTEVLTTKASNYPFDPERAARSTGRSAGTGLGDRRAPYVYDPAIVRAVNVAMVVQRPLLLSGEPGSGKSALARDVAEVMGWDYLEEVVSSRTRARDLLWHFDAVRRLGDAQANDREQVKNLAGYVAPGVLWRAFAPRRGQESTGVVVLVDEIDKAEPDVPNDLLGVLGSGAFRVSETGEEVNVARTPFVVFTTNGERELPEAFLRRCVHLELRAPAPWEARRAHLRKIAASHFPNVSEVLVEAILEHFEALRTAADRAQLRRPGTAEMLDAIRACDALGVDASSDTWRVIAETALWKHKAEPKLPTPTGTVAAKVEAGVPLVGGTP